MKYRQTAVLIAGMILIACSGPEDKKLKFFSQGKVWYDKGAFVEAGQEFKKAVLIDPNFAEANYLLGMTELKRENLAEALSAFSRAISSDPRHLKAQTQLGRVYLASGELVKAQTAADAVLRLDQRNEEALVLKGASLLAMKEIGQACGHLESMLNNGIGGIEVYLLLASAYREAGELRDAEKVLLKGEKLHPASVQLKRALASLLFESRRADQAAVRVQKVIELEPGSFSNRITLAGLYWDTGRELQARMLLRNLTPQLDNREACRLEIARFFVSRHKTADAEAELRMGIREDARSFQLRFALSDLYRDLDRSAQAVSILQECLALESDHTSPNLIRTKNLLARVHLERGEVDEARRYADDLIWNSPNDWDGHLVKGKIHLAEHDVRSAVSEFRTVSEGSRQAQEAFLLLAEARLLGGETNLALETLHRAQKRYPASRDVQRALARFHACQREYRKAEAYLQRVLDRNPDDIEARADLGDLLLLVGDLRRAGAEYQTIKRRAPHAPQGFAKLGELYLREGDAQRAIPEFEGAHRFRPDSDSFLVTLVQLYLKEKMYGAAVTCCEKRIRRNANDALAFNLLGQVHLGRRESRKAEAAFLKVLQLEPENVTPYLSLARMYAAFGEYRKAKGAYQKALLKKPDLWVAANNLAILLSEHPKSGGDLDSALFWAQQAQKVNPDDANVLDTLGWVYWRKGETERAIDLLMRACEKTPEAQVVNYHVGMALLKAGRRAEAKQHLAKSLSLPGDFSGRGEAMKILRRL